MDIERRGWRGLNWPEIGGFLRSNWFWLLFGVSIGAGLCALYLVSGDTFLAEATTFQKVLYYAIPIVGFGSAMIVFAVILWRDQRKRKP